MLNLCKRLLILYCYFVSAFYVVFSVVLIRGAKIDFLIQDYFALLWYADVSRPAQIASMLTIAFTTWGTGYLMSKDSFWGFSAGITLTVYEMLLAKLFYWDVLYVNNPSFWAAFWAYEHALLGLPFLPPLILLAIQSTKRKKDEKHISLPASSD